MMNMEKKHCGNCEAVMIYNPLLNRWECRYCGNCEELFSDPHKRWPGIVG